MTLKSTLRRTISADTMLSSGSSGLYRIRMSRGDPHGKIWRHIRRPGFERVACVGSVEIIRLSGRIGSMVVVGSFARGASRFVCPDRNLHDSAVMKSSLVSWSSTVEEERDNIAVRATRGFEIFVRPCSNVNPIKTKRALIGT